MNLIRKIFLVTATYDFQVAFKHIPGICMLYPMLYLACRCNCSNSWPHRQTQTRQSFQQTYGRTCKNHESLPEGSLAKSSRRTYRVGLRHYRKFCKSFRYTQFPPTQLTLRLFVTHLANTMSFNQSSCI